MTQLNSMGRRIITDVKVTKIEKRYIPSKYYVYICHVTWSDGSTNVIYRRYSRLFDLQSKLMEMFPEDAGTIDPNKRIIPFLPGKKFLGRSHIREVALKRLGPIAEYCRALVKLPPKISQCREVLEFFEIEPEDISPPEGRKAPQNPNKISEPTTLEVYKAVSEYQKQEKGEISLHIGMEVEVIEKTDTGWWFVNVQDEQGWVPGTFLEREDGVKEDTKIRLPPGQEEQYLCTEEFHGKENCELSMDRGAVVDVLEKNLDGWWLVRYNDQKGLVPATYLIKTENFKIKRRSQKGKKKRSSSQLLSPGGPQIVKNLSEISELLKTSSSNVRNSSAVNSEDDGDDEFDDEYDEAADIDEPEEKVYSIQELSKILKEDKRGSMETDKVYESIRNMKSSLKRLGSIRPPPKLSVKVNHTSDVPDSQNSCMARVNSMNVNYITIADFSDAVGDGISFQVGQTVKVLEKSDNGWWYIAIENREGWAPASYIQSDNTACRSSGTPASEMKWSSSPMPVTLNNPGTAKPIPVPPKKPIAMAEQRYSGTVEFDKLSNNRGQIENRKTIIDEINGAKSTSRPLEPPPPPPSDKSPCFYPAIIPVSKSPDNTVTGQQKPIISLKPGQISSVSEDKFVKNLGNPAAPLQRPQPNLLPKSSDQNKDISKSPSDSRVNECMKQTDVVSSGGKVSNLAQMLQRKLEKPTVDASSTSNPNEHRVRASIVPPSKPLKQPTRPITPPTRTVGFLNMQPISMQETKSLSRDRLNAINSQDSLKLLDPKKYWSRPLPPEPKLKATKDNKQEDVKETPLKQTPVLPMKSQPRTKSAFPVSDAKVNADDDSDNEINCRPLQVSNLANVLKAKLGEIHGGPNAAVDNSKECGDKVSKAMPLKPDKPKINPRSTSQDAIQVQKKLDVKNVNTISDTKLNNDNFYCAIEDFPGVNESEIELVSGDQYELLEKAEGWWYVSSGDVAGWAPSHYFRKAETTTRCIPVQQVKSTSKMQLKMPSSGSMSQLYTYRACADFSAENDGELSLYANEQVVVLDQPEGGWWLVQVSGNEGWVPASYLEKW